MALLHPQRWLNPLVSSPLSRHFALMVIATSTAITMVMTALQLWFDYKNNIASTHDALSQVEISYSSSLSASLWTYDHTLVQSQLEGIANLLEIEWAEVTTEDESRWVAGEHRSTYTLEKNVPLFYMSDSGLTSVGRLRLISSLDTIYWNLAIKFAVVLFLNLIKTLCMSVIIIYLFHRFVGRHLIDLAAYLKEVDPKQNTSEFRLRDCHKRSSTDELVLLVDSINVMRSNVQSSFDTITEYRDGLEAALDKERELSGLQRQFVSMVSHEFRTPLAIIDGSAQRLERRKANVTAEKLSGAATKIRTAVLRMTGLMESILASAGLEDGKIKYQPADCDVAVVLREICSGYRDLNTGHRIIDDLDDLPETIIADEKLLRQAFSNLVSNAIKYAPKDTSVQVTARCGDRNDIVISVRDEGVGIPKDELDKLFQRFFRASTSTGIPGTGIGLHLVKHLIEMHGGEIGVESSEGEGSTFSVQLPVSQPSIEHRAADRTAIDDGFEADLVAGAAS